MNEKKVKRCRQRFHKSMHRNCSKFKNLFISFFFFAYLDMINLGQFRDKLYGCCWWIFYTAFVCILLTKYRRYDKHTLLGADACILRNALNLLDERFTKQLFNLDPPSPLLFRSTRKSGALNLYVVDTYTTHSHGALCFLLNAYGKGM